MYSKALLISLLSFSAPIYASQGSNWYNTLSEATLNEAIPDWALEEMTREVEPGESTSTSFAESHRMEIEGKLLNPPVWSEDSGYWYFEVDYGAESVLDCFLYDEAEHPLDLLGRLRSYVLPWYIDESMAPSDSFVSHSGMHLQNNHPVYGLDYVEYLTDENDNLGIAQTQGRISYQQDSVLACISVVFGYRQSFDRVFNKMVDSWEITSTELEKPFYREVFVSLIGGKAGGFSEFEFSTDSDGDVVIKRKVAYLITTRPGQVSLSDIAGVEYVTPAGDMINAYVSSMENGELASSLSLNSTNDGSWVVEGETKGKAVQFSIADGMNPMTQLAQNRTFKDVIADTNQQNFESWVWMPSADPSTFLPLKLLDIDRKKDENRVNISVGPMQMQSIISDSGSAKSATTSMGAITIELERVVQEGKIE